MLRLAKRRETRLISFAFTTERSPDDGSLSRASRTSQRLFWLYRINGTPGVKESFELVLHLEHRGGGGDLKAASREVFERNAKVQPQERDTRSLDVCVKMGQKTAFTVKPVATLRPEMSGKAI